MYTTITIFRIGAMMAILIIATASDSAATTYTWTGANEASPWYSSNNWDAVGVPYQAGSGSKISVPVATVADEVAIFDSETAVNGYMPTDNIELVRVSADYYPPSITVRNGQVNFNRAQYNGKGVTMTVGDGDMATLATANMAAATGVQLLATAWADSAEYVVKADGTLLFGADITWGGSARVTLLGGTFDGSGFSIISDLTNRSGNYVSFEQDGSTFTAKLGGQLPDEATVTGQFGDSFRLGGDLASDPAAVLTYTDDGTDFTVISVIPPPAGTLIVIK